MRLSTMSRAFPETPLSYFVDNTWRTPPLAIERRTAVSAAPGHTPLPMASHRNMTFDPTSGVREVLRARHAEGHGRTAGHARRNLRPRRAGPNGASAFVTSDQCMTCHSGNAWMGSKFVMILEPQSANPVNVSPYGEWRWSPMGLAGRDPIFYAQLDSELAYLKDRQDGSADRHQYLLPLPWRDGQAPAGHRSRLRSGRAKAGNARARLRSELDLQHEPR